MAIQSSTIAWKIPWTEESWTLTWELQGFKGKNNHLWLEDPREQILYFYNLLLLCKKKKERERETLVLKANVDCSLPGSSVHGIFQAIVLEWIAISFSRGSYWPRDRTRVSHIVDRRFTVWVTGEQRNYVGFIFHSKILSHKKILQWQVENWRPSEALIL